MMGDWKSWVVSNTGAVSIKDTSRVQSLWGGYGELLRLFLDGGTARSVIFKRILPPKQDHGSISDRRKRRSYQVELAWYQNGASLCGPNARVAKLLAAKVEDGQTWLLLEDLQASGFAPSRPPLTAQKLSGVRWLANFHAPFLSHKPEGLWEQGSYWHLGTRPEELRRMPSGPWKEHAHHFDQALRGARFQTLVHGDSKPANFLWNSEDEAAAVDFQYVGQGCGIRDVAYFLDCCFGESMTQDVLEEQLDLYFQELDKAVGDSTELDFPALEQEWRALFPVAWSDYQRFYLGWSGSSRMGAWSHELLERALRVCAR